MGPFYLAILTPILIDMEWTEDLEICKEDLREGSTISDAHLHAMHLKFGYTKVNPNDSVFSCC